MPTPDQTASPTPRTATEAATAAVDAFNARDHQRLAASLNYPHIRLANGVFRTTDSHDDFVTASRGNTSRLAEEGWHHTELHRIDIVQTGAVTEADQAAATKVHLALIIDRCRADGSVYNRFRSLWITTKLDGHWGIQFRSSYLT